jgi:hypothetical protein
VTNSARPRFDWDDPTLCPPKLRAVIDRLAEGGHQKQREQLRDCIRGIRPHVGYLYAKNLEVDFNKIRCPLKLRCLWCLRPDHVLVRRRDDFERVKIASQLLGAKAANEKTVRVWLLDWPSDGRPGTGARISRLLGEANDRERHYPAMNGFWGAELAHVTAVDFRAKIPDHIGPKPYRKLFLFASPEASLDYDRLRKSLPEAEIRSFHGSLLLAWQKYLLEWAESQWSASDQDTADWMVSKERNFLSLGRLRKTREYLEAKRHAHRERTRGKGQLITYGTRKQALSQVEAITERNLPKNYEKLMRKPIDANTHDKIMSLVRPQLETHFPVEPEQEESLPLTPKQIAQISAELRELERHMLAAEIAQSVADKLECRQQFSDQQEPDPRKLKPLVQ